MQVIVLFIAEACGHWNGLPYQHLKTTKHCKKEEYQVLLELYVVDRVFNLTGAWKNSKHCGY